MRSIVCTALALAFVTAGCSSPAASGDQKLTQQECRRYFQHTWQLDGRDYAALAGEEVAASDAATCADAGSVTRRHFDCAMAAQSVDALQACGAPNT